MRTSQLLLSTLKETPADAEVISHQLMLRAGMIRKSASGLYTWLPLGLLFLIPSVLAGLFYVKHSTALDRIAALEQQFQSPKTTYIDTIVQKRITVIYDTIYNQIIINNYAIILQSLGKFEEAKKLFQNLILTLLNPPLKHQFTKKK